jgi:hypothetical protein
MVSVQLCSESFMLNVIYNPFKLSVVMLSVVTLNAIAPTSTAIISPGNLQNYFLAFASLFDPQALD